MRKVILIALLLTGFLGYSQTDTAEAIVQKQIDAYNSRNMEAFLSFYADDAKIYYFPEKLNLDGKETIRKVYDPYFKGAISIECRITKRIVRGNMIIDEQFVNYNGTETSGVIIYEIAMGKIVKATYID